MHSMDIHERYVRLPTVDVSMLELLETSCKNDTSSVLHHLVQMYNEDIVKENVDTKRLETFRALLCYEYQLTFSTREKTTGNHLKHLCIKSIENVFFPLKHLRDASQVSVLYDIVLLQMVLYSNSRVMHECILKFQTSMQPLITSSNEKIMYIKAMECLVESLQLKQFLCQSIKEEDLKELSLIFLRDVKLWLTMKEDIEWRGLALILPKIINTFRHEDAAFPIWNFILNELDDYKESLAAFCILSDIYFSTESRNTEDLYKLWATDQFWSLILNGIESSLKNDRKQALFIMKKAICAMTELNKNFASGQNSLTPFMCNHSCKTSSTVKDIKDKFFLILEALEEKQLHLVTPALSHIPKLLKANNEHASCGNCFSATWVRCLFKRILCHENNNVVKWGLIQACRMDTEIYSEKFVKLLVNVLNNTFLYECQNNENWPEIVTALIELFTKNNESFSKLLSTFLVKIGQVAWGPVAIFYVTMAMEVAASKTAQINKWHVSELEPIKALVSSNLTMHSHVLRMASQIQILNMIPNSLKEIRLADLAQMLATFPHEEAFRRKGLSWNIISLWLPQVVSKSDAINFIKLTCEKYQYQSDYSEISTESFALMIFLMFDATLVFSLKECPAENALKNWLQLLNGIDMRPYADITSSIKVIKFLSNLQTLSLSGICDTVNRFLSIHTPTVLKFLQKNLRKVAATMCYDDAKQYVTLIKSFLGNKNDLIPHNEIYNYVDHFYKESVYILQNVKCTYNMEYLCGLHILCYSQNIFITQFGSVNHELYTVPLKNIRTAQKKMYEGQPNLKGKIVSDCHTVLAELTNQYLANTSPSTWYRDVDWLQNLLYLFELGGLEIVSIVAKTMQILITGKQSGYPIQLEDLMSVFDVCWRYTLPLKKNKLYWTSIKDLTGIIINPNLFSFPDSLKIAKEFINTIWEEADNISQLKKILLQHLELLPSNALKNFQYDLLKCLLHGYVPRRDKKIENQACLYIAKHFKDYYSEHMSLIEEYNVDATVRAQAIVLLHKLIAEDNEHASTFLPLVLKKLENEKNKRYFNYSQLHRLKNRIMQVLLVLEPVLNKASTVKLQETICNLILVESNQHSVRLMQEWLLVRIFVRNEDLHDKLWNFFEESIVTRPGCTVSAASIVYHVVQLLPSKSQPVFLQKGIPYIARCCLGQQFNMRLYSQVIFMKLYKLLGTLNYHSIMSEYKGLYDAVVESVRQGNLTKKSINIQDDFYFSVFHPIEDFSLQTIYYELPRLCDMEFDEWITTNLFASLKFEEFSFHPLKLLNSSQLLENYTISINLSKTSRDGTICINQSIDNDATGLSNIQKKMIPSTSGVSFSDEIFTPLNRPKLQMRHALGKEDEGLIVVASLLDRPPNLGGLARTCEIFGVTEFVIANLTDIKDKEFQSLSVSAEKWINIFEVKKHELHKYLLEQKASGWTLFGAEQTVNSINLMKIRFSKKSILVLGNEKDGMPPNLIPLFDTCIEIPQLGIIRSLNVHVTGAICIWQYVNQYAFTEKSL